MEGTASLEPASSTAAPLAAYGLVFAVALVVALVLTPLTARIGARLGLVQEPGGRRKHARAIPRIGGVPIFFAFIAAVAVAQWLVVDPLDSARTLPDALRVLRFDPKEIIRLTGLLIGSTLIFVVGLYDDWRELGPIPQFVAQVLAAAIAIIFLIIIEYVNNPLTGQQTPEFPYIVTVTVTLVWLTLMMNTVNWLDGLDGLAAGVVALACVVLFVNSVFRLQPPQHSVALLPVALLGATLGFLPFNFFPAKIFLGSSGAFLLGYVLGVLSIIGGAKMAAILLVLGLPLLDVAWQIFDRLRRGQNPAIGDRGHLHFRLLDMGLTQRQIVVAYYLFSAIFGGLALLITPRLYKLIALLVMAAITAVGFLLVSRRGPAPEE